MRQVQVLADRLGIPCPRVGVTASASSPVIVALGRPQLLWPVSMLESDDIQGQESVIAHEPAHLRRRDHWTAWGMMVAGWFWWWNPVYWVARRRIEENTELAGDSWAVWGQPENRAAYAGALLRISQQAPNNFLGAPTVGASRGDFLSFQRRLSMIIRHDSPPRTPRWRLDRRGPVRGFIQTL